MRVLSLVTVFAAAVSGVFAAAVDIKRDVSPAPVHEFEKRALATVYTNCTGTKRVALTFDDGPYNFDSRIRTILKNANVKATFFINVKNWVCAYGDQYINTTRALYADGHEFGNHGYAHRHYNTLTWDQMHDDLWKGELYLQRVLGTKPALFRPPYGEYNTLARNASGTRGQQIVLWNMDSGDSAGATVADSQARYQTAANGGRNILTLNHSTYNSTVEQVLPSAITTLKNAGYTFVTVSQCLGIPAYQSVTAPGVKDSSWVCT